jgi:hypothetical protein
MEILFGRIESLSYHIVFSFVVMEREDMRFAKQHHHAKASVSR